MGFLNKPYTVDFSGGTDQPAIRSVQGDAKAKTIHFLLRDGISPIDLTGCTVRVYILPYGMTTGLYEDCTVTGITTGKIDYNMSGNACAVAGVGSMNIEITKAGDPSVGYSPEIKWEITSKKDFSGSIIGSTVFSALQSALTLAQSLDSNAVHLAGAETITGLKSVPTPTAAAHIARKDYVDQIISAKCADSGWDTVSDTWTYASATTITVSAGALSKYVIGGMIKLTQTTVKYFYIVAMTDTLLTITAGSDFTLTNAAISNIGYCQKGTPVGFPVEFNFVPSYYGWTDTPTRVCHFSIIGRKVRAKFDVTGTGTTASVWLALPIPARRIGNEEYMINTTWGDGRDNGGWCTRPIVAYANYANSSQLMVSHGLGYAGGGWTPAGNKSVSGLVEYCI